MSAVDACVQPQPATQDEIRAYLPRSFRDRPMPGVFRYLYPAPTGVAPFGTFSGSISAAAGLPGSDPGLAAADLAAAGVRDAVLLPLTRGQLPNLDLGSALCAATNDWLAATWLERPPEPVRYHGSIRINPLDVDAAVREVGRWAGDDRMVQVAVPLESQLPYGHRVYFPLWEAVAASERPVAVRSEGYSGAAFHPTPGGFPRHYVEFASLFPHNFVYHLTSLIAEGVFERLPDLRFVFTDGGFDVLTPLMWRMDMDWPITRIEAPWVTKRPMLYLADHVRFVTGTYEGPPDDARVLEEWLEMTDAANLLIYGSGYPRWDTTPPGDVLPGLRGAARDRILAGNAHSLYRLSERVEA
jgi:uncharacterized protein